MNPIDLEKLFEEEALRSCEVLKKEHRYNPSYFLRMVQELGAVRAAQRLLASKEAQEGLTRLWEIGRLELSIEHMVASPRYDPLFTEEERAIARERLRQLGCEAQATPPGEVRESTETLAPDPLIDEVRGLRRALSERFGNDLDRLCEHLETVEKEYEARVVRKPPANRGRTKG
jgi:hypothetical protein